MSELEVKSLFALAGIPVLNIKPLIDGYGCSPSDPRYFETPPRQVWWFVKTPAGWIEIGWRKRVISIDWSDTAIRKVITSDDTTKWTNGVHAWTIQDALRYLTALKAEMHAQTEDKQNVLPPS